MSKGTNQATWRGIALLQRQVELVERLDGADRPERAVVSWPAGSGKTVALSAAVGALREKREAARVLIVAPPPLLGGWQDQLRHFAGVDTFVMTPQAYRLLQAETSKETNLWTVHSCVVVSVDFLKQGDRIAQVVAAPWDMVILDEVHRLSALSQRVDACRAIWQDERIPLVVANGSLPNAPDWLTSNVRTQKFVFSYAQAIQEGNAPRRTTDVVTYELTESERWIRAHIGDLWPTEAEERRAGFQALLMRRLESSIYAFEQTMRRLISEEIAPEDVSDFGMGAAEDTQEDAISSSMELNREIGERIVTALENERVDSKWEACQQLIQSRSIGDQCSGIIFTEFAETAEYLAYLVSSREWTAFLITGAQTMEERETALNRAREERGIVVATSVVDTGPSLGSANEVIHYDLPQNPGRLLQRCGHVEVMGRGFEVFNHHFLVSTETEAGSPLLKALVKKLKSLDRRG